MIRDEQTFKEALDRLDIDAQPRPEHRDALRAKMLQAFEQARFQEPPPPIVRLASWLRRPIMNRRLQQAAIAAAVLILIVTGLGWWGSHQGVAFGDVVRAVQALQGARFTVTTTGAAVGAGTIRFAILGDRMRQEMPDGSVCIIDFTDGTFLILMPQHKQAILTSSNGLPDEMRHGAQNWLADLRQDLVAGAAGAKDLGAREVAGRQAWGFQVTSSNERTEVWVDRQTNLPLRVEISRPDQDTTVVMSGFDFATPVDELVVSLTPPKGYAVMQTTVDAHSAGEQDAIELLRAYAEAGDNRFPQTLDLSAGGIGKVMETLGRKKGWQWSMSMTGTITRAMTFLHMVEGTRYVGANVRLGDASQPVFHYQVKDSAMYRVIYGDLSVREVPKDALPAAPTADPAGSRQAR